MTYKQLILIILFVLWLFFTGLMSVGLILAATHTGKVHNGFGLYGLIGMNLVLGAFFWFGWYTKESNNLTNNHP